MNAREASYRVLEPFLSGKVADLDKQVDKIFKAEDLSEKDRRLAYEITMGSLRCQENLDYIIDKFLSDKFKEDLVLRIVIRIGLYQMLYLDRVPVHAAVSESVNLMKKVGDYGLSKVVNGVLRSIEKGGKQALKVGDELTGSKKMTVEFSHPEWLINRWIDQFGSAKTKKLLKFNCQKPDIYVRRNITKSPKAVFESGIATATATTPKATGYSSLYYRLKAGLQPSKIEMFHSGYCTVQAPSSGWVVALLEMQKGDVAVDLCAAPGGKATLMAEMAGDEGMIIAADSSVKRLSLVHENAHRLGLRNIHIVVSDGSKPALSGTFDKVLLDAPCSGTGVIQRHPDARWQKGEADILACAKMQAKILDEAASIVAPGGVLVYSTCSLEKEENQEQVEAFLSRHSDFVLESAVDFTDRRYCTPKGYLFITPQDHGMDGMFAARLVRK